MATSHAIYDLVTHPEYIRPLREEIDRVIEEDGYEVDGENSEFKNLNKASLPKLKLLDSFLKESQRFGPPGFSKFLLDFSFHRVMENQPTHRHIKANTQHQFPTLASQHPTYTSPPATPFPKEPASASTHI
jgi:hypothetical protein